MPYYEAYDGITVKEIIQKWIDGDKIYDYSMPVMMDINDLWKYRDYTWTKDTARSGFGTLYKDGEKRKELPGHEKWETLKNSLNSGWSRNEPLHLIVGKDGKAKIGEGNHRLAIWKELGNKTVPVFIFFYSQIYQTSDSSYNPRKVESFAVWFENRTKGKSLPEKGYQYKYVRILRAMDEKNNIINRMDYVTLSEKFAKEHADHMAIVEDTPYHVVSANVKSENVFEAYNPGEYFYDGEPVAGKVVYVTT